MSTEQTGVNAPTSEEPTQDEHAPRGSRRAIRQAERAAEREAILTGQQPLLTRREMRRLREEAKALRAAVEAGEITPEQAQALQDPLADPGSVTAGRSSARSGDDVEAGLEESAEFPAVDEDGSFRSDYVGQGGQNPPASLSVPESPSVSAPSWRSLSAAEAVAISEIETGLMEAVDLPVATLDYDAHWAANTSAEPAPVPTRFSLKERLEGGPSSASDAVEEEGLEPQVAGGITGEADADEPPTSPYNYREGLGPAAREDATASSSQSADAVSAVSAVTASASGTGAADFATFAQAGAPAATESARSGLSAASASSTGSVRRPIVRIPAAAQGVRTVNISTGELSSVQPVDSSPSPQDMVEGQQVYGVGAYDEPMVEETSVEVDVEAEMPPAQAQQGAEFGSAGAPQWRSLHQPEQEGGFQEAVAVTGTGVAETTEVVSAGAVSPYAFYSDGAEGGNGPVGSSEWDSVAAPVAEAPEEQPYLTPVNEVTGRVPTPDYVPSERSDSSSRMGRVLMVALIIVVLLLIIAVVIWFVVSGRSSSNAMSAAVGAGEWIHQLV